MNEQHVKETPLESPPKRFETVREMLDSPMAEIDFLVTDLFPVGGFAAVVGRSGVNKSTFCRHLCLAIALPEKDFIGASVKPKHRRALYIYSEDSRNSVAGSFQRQMRNISTTTKEDLSNVETANLDEFETSEELFEFLEERTAEGSFDLICFDCYSDLLSLCGLEVNSNSDQRKLFPMFHSFKEQGTVILFNHHTSDKITSTGTFLGASALRQKVRVLIELVQGEDTVRYVHVSKSNYTDKQLPLECWIDNDFLFRTEGKRVPVSVLQGIMQNEQSGGIAVIDWDAVFEQNDVLEFATIKNRLMSEYGFSDSTAKRRIHANLQKTGYGKYRRSLSQQDKDGTAGSKTADKQEPLQLILPTSDSVDAASTTSDQKFIEKVT